MSMYQDKKSLQIGCHQNIIRRIKMESSFLVIMIKKFQKFFQDIRLIDTSILIFVIAIQNGSRFVIISANRYFLNTCLIFTLF